MTFAKADIALKVAKKSGFMRVGATEIVDKLLEIMKSRLILGQNIMISVFGKRCVKSKKVGSSRIRVPIRTRRTTI